MKKIKPQLKKLSFNFSIKKYFILDTFQRLTNKNTETLQVNQLKDKILVQSQIPESQNSYQSKIAEKNQYFIEKDPEINQEKNVNPTLNINMNIPHLQFQDLQKPFILFNKLYF